MSLFTQRDFRRTHPKLGQQMLSWFLATLAFIAIVGYFSKVKAAEPWTGCFAGVFGGYATASAIPDGSPVGFSTNGQVAGFSGGCDKQFGQMVVGGEAGYGWVFGKASDLGVDNQLTLTARAGYLIGDNALLYGHGGWVRTSGSGIPDVDGWNAGLGGEFRLPGSAMFLDARWTHTWFNESDLGAPSNISIGADEFRLGLKIKFGAAMLADAPAAKQSTRAKVAP